ncbi:MAG TPA: acyltransferase [Deltaproteobacteria bacterium]|nr:acyltransferase [Deltaproteobacteria bacterium]HOM29767.1 acyltransferase [Deltaproteobacteria bacterium]HPP81651.1 acyltransferase [Deltaproteobacteria bacterium]
MKELVAVLKGQVFRWRCALFYPNVTIGKGLRIFGRLLINARGRVKIGDNCLVREIPGSEHKCACIDVISPEAYVTIGDNAVLCAARITARYGITIGDNVIVEDAGVVDTDFHDIDASRSTPTDENHDRCRITIGSNVSIGALSFITKGVTIGDGAVVAPASVVTKPVKPGSFVYGNPAVVRPMPHETEAPKT